MRQQREIRSSPIMVLQVHSADQATISAVQQNIISGMANVGLTANEISMLSAALNTLDLPIGQEILQESVGGKRKK